MTNQTYKFEVTVSCITDNPSVNSKVVVLEYDSIATAREVAEYYYGAARILEIVNVF